MNKIHFISGFPRSGSTLLGAILRQNPRFTTSFRSPVEDMLRRQLRCASDEFAPILQGKMDSILRATVEAYYVGADVAFDTNRGWMLRGDLIKALYPDSKMILCVRDLVDIFNSWEKLHRANHGMLTGMYDEQTGRDVFTRARWHMTDNGASVTSCYLAMQQYLAADEKPFIMEYEDLARNPLGTMKAIYKYLGEEYYPHDFSNIEQIPLADEYDMLMRTPGLHRVGKEVFLEESKCVLPDVLVDGIKKHFTAGDFWRKKDKRKGE